MLLFKKKNFKCHKVTHHHKGSHELISLFFIQHTHKAGQGRYIGGGREPEQLPPGCGITCQVVDLAQAHVLHEQVWNLELKNLVAEVNLLFQKFNIYCITCLIWYLCNPFYCVIWHSLTFQFSYSILTKSCRINKVSQYHKWSHLKFLLKT